MEVSSANGTLGLLNRMKPPLMVFLLLSLPLFESGCRFEEAGRTIKSFSISDTISIPLPEGEMFSSSRTLLFSDLSNNEYLAVLSYSQNSIQQFNFPSLVVRKEFCIDTALLNPNLLVDFCFYNPDSVIFIAQGENSLVFQDMNYSQDSKVISLDNNYYVVLQPDNNFRLEFLADQMCLYFGLRTHSNNRISYFSKDIVCSYDLITGNSLYFGRYPLKYIFSKGFPSMQNPSVAYSSDKVIFSFGPVHDIYVYDRFDINRGYKKLNGQSHFLRKRIRGSRWKNPIQIQQNYKVSAGYYLGIYYNKWEEEYYRVVKHPQPLRDSLGFMNPFNSSRFSIEVFDHSLNLKQEWLLNDDELDFTKLLISKSGVFIPNIKNRCLLYRIDEETSL